MKILNRVPRWDKNRAMHLKVGFIMSLAFVLMAFNYTSYGPAETPYIDEPYDLGEIEATPPRMKTKTTVPPPPKPKVDIVDIIVPDDEPEFTNEPEPVETKTESTTTSEEPSEATPAVAPAPKVEIVEPVEEPGPAFVSIAQRMPVHNTCDLEMDESEKRKCTTAAMLSHIYSNLKYPAIARENQIEGTVVVSFIIDKNGDLQEAEIMRDIGGGCGQAVLDVIKDLGKFYPGKQNGRPVAVIYRVPVKFELK